MSFGKVFVSALEKCSVVLGVMSGETVFRQDIEGKQGNVNTIEFIQLCILSKQFRSKESVLYPFFKDIVSTFFRNLEWNDPIGCHDIF